MMLEFITFRKRRKMYEQNILAMLGEIDKLRDGKTTLRVQRYELQEEVKKLEETLLARDEEIKILKKKNINE